MSSVIIFKKDLEKLGKLVMKDFYEQIHDDYFLKEFDEVKLKRKYYDENITKEFLSFYKKQDNIDKSLIKLSLKDLVKMPDEDLLEMSDEDLLKIPDEDLLKKINNKIQHNNLDVEIIYEFFDQMKRNLKINKQIDFEIDEDLFCSIKAFINLYLVYHFDHKYLEIELPTFQLD